MRVCSNQSLFIVGIWRDQKSIETSKKDPMREIGRKSLQILPRLSEPGVRRGQLPDSPDSARYVNSLAIREGADCAHQITIHPSFATINLPSTVKGKKIS